MLSVSKPMNASQAGKYFDKDDYYLAEKGQWLGKGAAILGLEGDVVKEAFHNLAVGKDLTVATLVQAKGDTHRAGIDLTFSAPKSVSVLVLANQAVKGIHDQAVKNTLAHVEEYYTHARETHNNDTQVVSTGNLVVAKFDHLTSRELDPQLHSHCFLINMTQRQDGQWRAFHNDLIYKDQKELGRIYRNELANLLEKAGYALQVTDRAQSFFEIKGVAKELIEEFSKRREQVEQKVKELKESGLYKDASNARLYEIAALQSRASKEEISKEQLKTEWNRMIEEKGLTLDDIKNEVDKQASEAGDRQNASMNEYDYIRTAIAIKTENESVFSKAAVLDTAIKLSLGQKSIAELDRAFTELLNDKTLVKLGTNKDGRGNEKEAFTTPEMLRIERKIIDLVNVSKGRWEGADRPEVERFLMDKENKQEWKYTDGQRQYILTALASHDGVNLIQGDAGSGKTAGAAAIREFAESHGCQILGVGFTGKAAEELKDVGIESRTIDSFLQSKAELNSKTIMLVDEASMVGSKQGLSLLTRLNNSGAKIVIIGDLKQFQSISAGRLFSELQSRTTVDKVEMKEVLRQTAEHMKEAVKALNDLKGMDTTKALDVLEQKGSFIEIKDQDQRIEAVMRDYLEGIQKGKETLILTGTNKNRVTLNHKIRSEMVKCGKLEGGHRFEVLTVNSVSAELSALADSYDKGQVLVTTDKIDNDTKRGFMGTIGHIDADSNTITAVSKDGQCAKIELAKDFDKISVFNREERSFAVDDKIIFLKNDSKLGVQNGLQGIVKDIDERGNITVRTKKGKEVRFNLGEVKEKGDAKYRYNYIDHAYALTEYKSQGATVDKAIWLAEKGDSKTLYVVATRAKEDCRIYTHSKDELREQVGTSKDKTSTLAYPDPDRSFVRTEKKDREIELSL